MSHIFDKNNKYVCSIASHGTVDLIFILMAVNQKDIDKALERAYSPYILKHIIPLPTPCYTY